MVGDCRYSECVHAKYEIGDFVTVRLGGRVPEFKGAITAMTMIGDSPRYMIRGGVFWAREDQIVGCYV